MSNYTSGKGLEYEVRDAMYEAGAIHVVVSAGSRGCVDLVGLFPEFAMCIQCKRGKGKVSRAEMVRLTCLARKTGRWCNVAVVSKPKRGKAFFEKYIKKA